MLSQLANRLKTIRISNVERIFLLTLLIFGLLMIVLIPVGAGYDEEDHLIRTWELSSFSFLPGQLSPQDMQYPILFRDLAYRQQANAGIIDPSLWRTYARTPLYEGGFVRKELKTNSVYSPPLLLPQALAMRLGRSLHLSALVVWYVSRLAGLLSYLLLVWLALRIIPFGKWILVILALTPMALFQATTLTPDSISNGIGFLFIAGCLKLAQFERMDWKKTAVLILLIFLLLLGKVNLTALVLLPFLIIPPSRFESRGAYFVLVGVTVVLFLVEVAGWNLIATRHSDALLANNADAGAQLRYILAHPLVFPTILIKDPFLNGWTYLQGWINGYGYLYWTPPLIVSIIFLLSLGTVLLIDSTREQLSQKDRVVFLFVFIASYLATAVPLYLTFTTVALNELLGVQGRYFVPLALLPVLVLASILVRRKSSISSNWTMVFLFTALALNLAGIVLAFYVPCGTTYYQTGLCYRPLYKDFSNETHLSAPITDEVSVVQEIRVAYDGFSELRILLTPSNLNDHGTTRFTLRDRANDEMLLDTTINNNAIHEETWYPLKFEPDWESAGKTYLLEISSSSSSDGLKLLYTPQSEFNLGDLRENGQPLEDDMVLQYGCATGLRKILSTGKP